MLLWGAKDSQLLERGFWEGSWGFFSRTDLLVLCHPACHLVISTNSSGAVGTGMYRERLRLPIGDKPIGSSAASLPGELPIGERGTGTAFCHCLNDTASWRALSGDSILGERLIFIIDVVIVPRGRGTTTLHTVRMHKQRLLLHKQFLNLNVKIRQHLHGRNVLGKHRGAVRMLWAKERVEVQVPGLSLHRWMIHRHQTWRLRLKEGSTVTPRIFTDSLFPA